MKRFLLILFAVILFFCACGIEEAKVPSYENDVYSGFSDVPVIYSAEDAIKDGCFVIEDGVLVGGRDKWERFLSDAESGKDSFLRAVHFIEGEPYFTDLYYTDSVYQTFEKNHERGITAGKKFNLLRRLNGKAGIPAKDAYFYVLTDSEELTYHDVSYALYASNFELVTDIPYEWLGFTVYLD